MTITIWPVPWPHLAQATRSDTIEEQNNRAKALRCGERKYDYGAQTAGRKPSYVSPAGVAAAQRSWDGLEAILKPTCTHWDIIINNVFVDFKDL